METGSPPTTRQATPPVVPLGCGPLDEGGKSYTFNLMTSLGVNYARYLVSRTAPDLVEQYWRSYRVSKDCLAMCFSAPTINSSAYTRKYPKIGKCGPNPLYRSGRLPSEK